MLLVYSSSSEGDVKGEIPLNQQSRVHKVNMIPLNSLPVYHSLGYIRIFHKVKRIPLNQQSREHKVNIIISINQQFRVHIVNIVPLNNTTNSLGYAR